MSLWARQLSRYSDWLRDGRSGNRIPVEGEIFRTCPDRPWGPHSLLYNGYRVFPGGKERPGRDADPSSPSSAVGNERVELYLYSPVWAVRPVQSLSACTRVTFTFYRYLTKLNHEDKNKYAIKLSKFFYLPTDAQENCFNLLAPEFYI